MIYHRLDLFLKNYPKKEQHTHTIYGGGDISCGGSYTIPEERIDEFYDLISKAIFKKQNNISIVEKVQPICRLVIDLDFKYKDKVEGRQYNEDVLKLIIKDIFYHIDKLYDLSENQRVCWVMEKDSILDAPQKNYKVKDGIHFLFPYIIAEKKTYQKLRDEIIQEDYSKFFIDNGFTPPSNKIEEVIDNNIYKGGNWFIYGSGKPNEIRYQLTKIFKLSDDNLLNLPTDVYVSNPSEIVKMNSVTHNEISVGYKDHLKSKMSSTSLKSSISIESISSEDINLQVLNNVKKHDIEVSKELATKCLSEERASDYQSWMEVGYCLHSISPTLLPSWIAFSKKWPMYNNSKECEKQWEWFDKNNNKSLTIGSLHYWAKLDNLEKYNEIKVDSLSDAVLSSVKTSGSHADVANVIYHYFKDCFVCANIKENAWYFFNELNGGRWEMTEVGHELRSKLSNEIVDVYNHYGLIYKTKSNEEDNEELKEMYDKRHTSALKVQIQLKDSSYKDKIMKECKEFFYDKKFSEKLNDQKNLIGFENGVYDLNKSVFRGGLPSDYVSLSTGLSLPVVKSDLPIDIQSIIEISKELANYDELNEGLNDFLEKVFPVKDVLEYTLRFLSSCLSGEIREEKFYFWTGSGGNGKSKLVELLDFTLGDYSKSMDVGFLTTKRGSSSAASPELENIKNARFVSMSEPEKTDTIYIGKLKQMTGGDKMTSRGLFKETTQFKPQFKIVLMCNDLPQLGGNDGGIWRRIEVVKFISKFTNNEKSIDPARNQYYADEQLSMKLEQWKLLFMIKLLEKYEEYDKTGTLPPKEVKEETKGYQNSNDLISNWVDDCLTECDGFTKFNELYDSWEDYCDDEGISSRQRPDKKEVKAQLLKLQEKTEYGLSIGKLKSDNCPNGTSRSPMFNFKINDED
uniref:SF3 helicase domain-containing protein n=1 Tax=viral metagenome TaxID=1070528 RepID=A0A6C0L1X1_9ZZZZ|tara:strand:+ start:1884 stop:4613 length:2730 start_codon:yes stop_codon:yes gene_type:complete